MTKIFTRTGRKERARLKNASESGSSGDPGSQIGVFLETDKLRLAR